MTPVARLDWTTNVRISRTSSPSPFAGADGNRRSASVADRRDHDRRDRLCDDDRDERLGDTHGRGDHDREKPEHGRSRLVHASQVVAAVEEQCRRPDVLGRLDEGEERCREKRLLQAVRAEDLVGEGGKGDDEKRREDASHDLDQ